MAKRLEPKKLYISTRLKIRRLYTKDGFTKQELLIMYRDYDWRQVLQSLRGLKKAEKI